MICVSDSKHCNLYLTEPMNSSGQHKDSKGKGKQKTGESKKRMEHMYHKKDPNTRERNKGRKTVKASGVWTVTRRHRNTGG